MSGLLLKNIDKVYDGKVKAVDDFNLKIDDKEFIVFVGPSGCGKSTTLRMIAGLEDITAGELYIDDMLVNDIAPKDRDIAMVFQNYALYPHMSVAENMAFGLKLRKLPKHEIEEKVKEAARMLEIEPLLDRRPKALSGGQRQRVAMGRAIVRNPKVFLMDEPLSNLDAKLRVQMRIVISKLHKKLNTTFIYVTHDQTEAMTLGTRIVVMKDGVVQQVDTPAEIYHHPKNLFVAGFIGSPQMNFLYAKALKKGKEVQIHLPDGSNFQLDEIQSERMIEKECAEGNVVLGIRPEKVKQDIPQDQQKDYVMFKAIVDLIENLGAETYVHVTIQDKDFIIKSYEGKTYRNQDVIEFGFKKEDMHVFNRESEETIL